MIDNTLVSMTNIQQLLLQNLQKTNRQRWHGIISFQFPRIENLPFHLILEIKELSENGFTLIGCDNTLKLNHLKLIKSLSPLLIISGIQ